MDAQDFAVNDCRQCEEIEDLAARFPDRRVAVLLLALLVETVHLGDLSRFVVAAYERDLVGISARLSACLVEMRSLTHEFTSPSDTLAV